MKIVSNIPFSDTVDSVTRQFLTGRWCCFMNRVPLMTCAFSRVGKIKALKRYAQAPLWIGRADLTSTERQRKDCSVAAHIRHRSHDTKLRLWVFASQQLSSIWPRRMIPSRWGCSVLLSFQLSSCRLRSAEDSQSIALHYCAIRVKCDIFTTCVFTALCKIFMYGNTLSEQTFGNVIWNEILCMQEFVKITEKKVKCHNVIFTIYILLTAFGIIMLYIRQECNYEVSLINRRIFCVCINLQTLNESEAFIFCQLSP